MSHQLLSCVAELLSFCMMKPGRTRGWACCEGLAGSHATVSWCLAEVVQGPTTFKLRGPVSSGGSMEKCWSPQPADGFRASFYVSVVEPQL